MAKVAIALVVVLSMTVTCSVAPPERGALGEPIPGKPISGETIPGETIPGETIPGETIPGKPISGETIPGETIPGETIPGETIPGETISGETIPGEPIAGEPIAGEPIPGEPISREPIVEELVPGEPASGEPVSDEPAPPSPQSLGCVTDETAEGHEHACELPAGNVTLTTGTSGSSGAGYAKLECEDDAGGSYRCAQLPRLPELRDLPLRSFGVGRCRLPDEPLACALWALGARGARHLVLRDVPSGTVASLRPRHLRGLSDIAALTVREAPSRTASTAPAHPPVAALEALPELRALTISGARLRLEPDAFRPAPPLRRLELSSCPGLAPPPGAFRGLAALHQLSLRDDGIAAVEEATFEGLVALEELDLAVNALRSLPARAFAGAPQLRVLNLIGNPLEEVASETFAGLMRLERLEVFDNRAPLRLGERALAALPALQQVRLQRCQMRALPGSLLGGARALRELLAAGNELRELPAGLLRGLSGLTRLDLADNRIEAVVPPLFADLKNLTYLDLRKNLIEELPDKIFYGLNKLETLVMSENRLRLVSADAFAGAGALRSLSLASNLLTLRARGGSAADPEFGELEFGERSPLARLTALRRLDLSRNRVDAVFYDWRFLLLDLTSLDLSYNRLTELTDSDINFLQRSIAVDVRHNNITTIRLVAPGAGAARGARARDEDAAILFDDNPLECDCYLAELVRRLAAGPRALAEPRLEPGAAQCVAPPALAGRALRDVPPAALACELPCLAAPGCSACELRPALRALRLQCDAPPPAAELAALAALGLSDYEVALRLRRAPASLAAVPPRVANLSLAGLDLAAPPAGPAPPTLRELDLTDNRLTRAPLDLLAAPGPRLLLARNPFTCDCDRASDVRALQRSRLVRDAAALTCADGRPLSRVDAAALCARRVVTAVGGAAVALLLAAAAGTLLAYRHRAALRVRLLGRGWAAACLRGEETPGDEEYDAFVSFAHRDRWVVTEHLRPRLEDALGYRLCVHYRDWVPGDWVPAQISRSVRAARRTIAVVSPSFLRSPWSLMEFRAAHEYALEGNRPRLVVVVLGEPPADEQTEPDVRAYLRANTYLRWGEPAFWAKLRAALGPPPARGRKGCKGPGAGGGPLDVWLTEDGKLLRAAENKI